MKKQAVEWLSQGIAQPVEVLWEQQQFNTTSLLLPWSPKYLLKNQVKFHEALSIAQSNLGRDPPCLRVRFYGRRQSKQKFAARSVSPSSTSTNLESAFRASAKMVRISVLGGECGLEQQRP